MSFNKRESAVDRRETAVDRRQDYLPEFDKTMTLMDAVERLGPLLQSFKLEQTSRDEMMHKLMNENERLKKITAVDYEQTRTETTDLVNKIAPLETQLEERNTLSQGDGTSFNRLSSENSKIKAQNADLTKLLEEKNESLQNIEAVFNKQVEDANALRAKIKDLEKERDSFKRNTDCYKNALEKEQQQTGYHVAEMDRLRTQLDENQRYQEKLQHDKRKLEAELLESNKRLSRLMGTKLSDNNPDIADLSDMNRPTKLAEKYSELYDNQWTDAYEVVVEATDEITGINVLLTLLQDMRDFCGSLAETQSRELTKAVLMTSREKKQLNQEFKKLVKDFRRATAETAKDGVYELYMAKLNRENAKLYQKVSNAHVKLFAQACLELCWLMSVQDPPVVLGKGKTSALDTFDTALYKAYTQTGPYLDYLVWPPLYLHENGPLLTKGVAQGMKLSTQWTDAIAKPGSAVSVGNAMYDQASSAPSHMMEGSLRQLSSITGTKDFSLTASGSSGIYDNAFQCTTQTIPPEQKFASKAKTTTARRGIPNDTTVNKGTNRVSTAFCNPPSEPENMLFFKYYIKNNGHAYTKERLGEENYNKCVIYSEHLRAKQEMHENKN